MYPSPNGPGCLNSQGYPQAGAVPVGGMPIPPRFPEPATKSIPVPMFLSRIDDNQSELEGSIRRLAERLDVVLCPAMPAAASGGPDAPGQCRSALAERLDGFSVKQVHLIRAVNDLIERLEV